MIFCPNPHQIAKIYLYALLGCQKGKSLKIINLRATLGADISKMRHKIENRSSQFSYNHLKSMRAKYLGLRPSHVRAKFTHSLVRSCTEK